MYSSIPCQLHLQHIASVDLFDVNKLHLIQGKIVKIYRGENIIYSYNVKPEAIAILMAQSKFSLVKSSTGSRAQYILEDTINLELLKDKKNDQKNRIESLNGAILAKHEVQDQVSLAQDESNAEINKLTEMGPNTTQNWIDYARKYVKSGLEYAKQRFIDVDVNNTKREAYAINKGLQTTKAFTGASVFDPTEMSTMIVEEIKAHL